MAKVKLFTGALPKGAGGRKPAEINSDLYDALLEALTNSPTTTDDDGETRPMVVGDTSRLFDSEGKASTDGRRYGRPIAEKLDATVRVRVIESAPGSGKYGWVLYVPLAATTSDAPEAA